MDDEERFFRFGVVGVDLLGSAHLAGLLGDVVVVDFPPGFEPFGILLAVPLGDRRQLLHVVRPQLVPPFLTPSRVTGSAEEKVFPGLRRRVLRKTYEFAAPLTVRGSSLEEFWEVHIGIWYTQNDFKLSTVKSRLDVSDGERVYQSCDISHLRR